MMLSIHGKPGAQQQAVFQLGPLPTLQSIYAKPGYPQQCCLATGYLFKRETSQQYLPQACPPSPGPNPSPVFGSHTLDRDRDRDRGSIALPPPGPQAHLIPINHFPAILKALGRTEEHTLVIVLFSRVEDSCRVHRSCQPARLKNLGPGPWPLTLYGHLRSRSQISVCSEAGPPEWLVY